MYHYVKSLQYPVNIKYRNPALAKIIISQYGGPDGELGASLRYLSQRFGMPDQTSQAILNDVGTEELAHLEMVGTIVHQLTKDATIEEIKNLLENKKFNILKEELKEIKAADIPALLEQIDEELGKGSVVKLFSKLRGKVR